MPTQEDARRVFTRRKRDVELIAGLASILGLALAVGIAWGTAQAVVTRKLDTERFTIHVAEMQLRLQAESTARMSLSEWLIRIEHKIDAANSRSDSTNARLSRFVCYRQPAYCQ